MVPKIVSWTIFYFIVWRFSSVSEPGGGANRSVSLASSFPQSFVPNGARYAPFRPFKLLRCAHPWPSIICRRTIYYFRRTISYFVFWGPRFCRFRGWAIYLEDHLLGSGISRVDVYIGFLWGFIRALRPIANCSSCSPPTQPQPAAAILVPNAPILVSDAPIFAPQGLNDPFQSPNT